MITIPSVVEKIIQNTPFLEEALSEGILNLSALARKIKPTIEEETMKEVQEGAIVMALKRLSLSKKKVGSSIKRAFKDIPDMIVRSNLVDITLESTFFSKEEHKKILKYLQSNPHYFLTVSQSVFETTIIASREMQEYILGLFPRRAVVARFENLSSITIKLTKETTLVPGVYYMILRHLAWEDINLVEVISTYTELTLVLKNEDTDKAFSAIKKLFK